MSLISTFQSLQNRSFRWLFSAQAINLLGDSISWVGLALLANQIADRDASFVLAVSLTVRVVVFVFVAPYAGVFADKIDRKKVLLSTHLLRMMLVSSLPFAYHEWHIYTFIFFFSILHAIFTPTYKATVPLIVTEKELYPKAISLSSATYQLLGILGPGIAGGIAVFADIRFIFWADALTFFISGICIFMIPVSLKVRAPQQKKTMQEVKTGTKLLFGNPYLKNALLMQFVVSIIGAQVLVNTIHHIKQSLMLSDGHYGWTMSVMGIGAAIGSLTAGQLQTKNQRLRSTMIASILACAFIAFANEYSWALTLVFWSLIGLCQSMVNIPTDTLIADNIDQSFQGRVYGAHFAWSHFWWVMAYPIAGLSNRYFEPNFFLIGGIVAISLWIGISLINRKALLLQ